jgi:hypothetical protein
VTRFGLCLLIAAPLGPMLRASAIDAASFKSGATFIDFDDLTGGSCNLCGPSVTNQYSKHGVIFNNPTYPGMETIDTNLTYGIPGASFPNALYVYQGGLIGQPPALPFEILFSAPVATVGFNYSSSSDSFLRLDAYDIHNTLLETLTFVGTPSPIGLGGFAGIEESAAIARLDLSYHPNSDPLRTFNFSINDLQFQVAPAVPEASTSTLMLTGLGFLMISVCRRPGRQR